MDLQLESLDAFHGALALTFVECVADTAAKHDGEMFGVNDNIPVYGGYLLQAYMLQKILPHNNLALTNAYWNTMTNITHALISKFVFSESLTNTQYAGLAVCTLGIWLLKSGESD